MVGSAANASAFIDRVVAASGARPSARLRAILKRKQQDVPGGHGRQRVGAAYYAELVRQAELRLRFAVGPAVFPVRPRQAGAARRHEPPVRRHVPAVMTVRRCGTRRSRRTRCSEDGTLVGRFYLDMHPRRDKYNHAAQFPHPDRRRRPPDSGGRADLQPARRRAGRSRPDDARRRGDVLPRVRPPGARAARRPPPVDRHRRHQHRAGFRRSAVADARGMDVGSDDAGRPSRGTIRPTSRFPPTLVTQMRRASEFGKALNVRQQMVYAQLSLSVLRPRSESTWTRRRWSRNCQQSTCRTRTSKARTSRRRSAISTATPPSTTPTCGRWSSRRTCSASSIRQSAGAGVAREVSRRGARARRLEAGGSAGRDFPRPALRFQGVGELAESRRIGRAGRAGGMGGTARNVLPILPILPSCPSCPSCLK